MISGDQARQHQNAEAPRHGGADSRDFSIKRVPIDHIGIPGFQRFDQAVTGRVIRAGRRHRCAAQYHSHAGLAKR
jgi:hypothetical protein